MVRWAASNWACRGGSAEPVPGLPLSSPCRSLAAQVERTRGRPLAAGLITPPKAIGEGMRRRAESMYSAHVYC